VIQVRRWPAWREGIRVGLWGATLLALAMGLALAPLRWNVTLFLGTGVALTVLVHPWLGLLLIAVAIPFGPLMPLPIAQAAADVNELLLLLVMGAWLARGVARRAIVIPHAPLLWPGLLLMGAFLATLPGAWSLKEALVEVVKWAEGVLLYVIVVAVLPPRRVPWLVGALVLAGVAQAALGLYQFARAIGPSQFLILGRFVRAYGTFRQPNPFGGYLGLVAPVAISLAWWGLARIWRQRGGNIPGWWRSVVGSLAWAAAAGVIVLGIGASWSRGAWLGCAAAMTAVILARGWRSAGGVALAVMIGVALLLVVGYTGGGIVAAVQARMGGFIEYARFTDPRTLEVTDANFPIVQRLAQWWAAWSMFSDHPWLGVGIGNYAAAYPAYALPRWYEPLGHAHNYYLNMAAETGLVGLTAYLVAGALVFIWVVRRIRDWRAWPQALAIGVLGVLTHLSVHNLFDNLYVQHIVLHLALLLGALTVLNAHLDDEANANHDAT